MSKLKTYLKHPFSFLMLLLLVTAAIITVASIIFIIIYILEKGIPNLTGDLFSLHFNSKNQSMLPSIINTVSITFLTLLFAVPIGIFSAIYLVEYAKKGSKLVKVIRITTETLAGIPSIVFGLFGFLAFVITLGWNYSMISGVLTLTMMVLPTIIRTTEEALLAVPDSYREGSFGLGAGKLRTIFRIILPSAVPGILSGVILAIGRIVGETAALIYTSGTVADTATSLMDSARTLSVHLYCLLNEGLFTDQAYATAVILLLLVVGINALSNFVAKKIAKV
ncbi:MAG: phosphate ABC transporter permease PstA [Ruminococcus sp.]